MLLFWLTPGPQWLCMLYVVWHQNLSRVTRGVGSELPSGNNTWMQ